MRHDSNTTLRGVATSGPVQPAAPVRQPAKLAETHNSLNEHCIKGRRELALLEQLVGHLRGTMLGPVPTPVPADGEDPYHPLGAIPSVLEAQMTTRAKLYEELADLLGMPR